MLRQRYISINVLLLKRHKLLLIQKYVDSIKAIHILVGINL
jgi:hypothetical protein